MNKIKQIQTKIAPIFDAHKVVSASLFGSMARNEDTAKSDVDLIIKFLPNQGGLFEMVRLKRALERKLKKKVDLLTERSINSRLKKYILKDKILIYEKR